MTALGITDPDAARRARFRAVFERELDYVWTSLRRLGIQPRDLEDVTQEVFVQVYRKLDDYDPERPLRPWLFAFAARCASDWRRLARHRFERVGIDHDPPSPEPEADLLAERRQNVELALEALAAVDPERRPVLILHDFDHCSMKEIAAALSIPLFTGYSRLRVAREEFTAAARRRLAQRGEP
jgi:RNA polymerase sigma-70 factor (ECF subfamily)